MTLLRAHWPYIVLISLILCLLWLGVLWIVPPVYRLTHSFVMLYRGYGAFGVAALLACFHRQAARGMIWISLQIHRWLSAMAMLGVLWVEAAMHMFNIPHMEGWWLPVVGGSFISSTVAWIKAKANHGRCLSKR